MSIEEIVQRVEEAAELGATQIMLQGGLNPALDLRWYEDMLRPSKIAFLASGCTPCRLRRCCGSPGVPI